MRLTPLLVFLLSTVTLFIAQNAKVYAACRSKAQLGLQQLKEELASRNLPNWSSWEAVAESESYDHIKGFLFADGPGDIPYDLYLSHSQKEEYQANNKKPLIVLFPGFQGASWIDHHIAKYFASHGFHMVISHYRDTENDRNPEKIYEVTKNNILAGMEIIDALSQLQEVDADNIGLLGYSFGGIRGGFLSLVDERIKAVNFVVSSGQFAQTIIDSSLPAIKELREEHKAALGSPSIEDYHDYLENSLPFEPYQAICSQDYSHYFLVTARADTIVPTALQDSFVSNLKGSQSLSYNLGHIPSVLWFALRDLKKSEQFFNSIFRG